MTAHPKSNSQGDTSAKTIRAVLDGCADCDTCRFLMEDSCLLFPELYRLYDVEKEHGWPIGKEDLRHLSDLCTLCGLCPCPDIPMDIIRGKSERVRLHGLSRRVRWLADVQRFGQMGAVARRVFNRILSSAPVCGMVQKAMGVHPNRRLPALPSESFFTWARHAGLDRKPELGPKVAYFAGCSAGYLFPEVARAAVALLRGNGIAVYVPTQQCCGMPTLVEGDRHTTLERMSANLRVLLEAVAEGFTVVCSCPTCGFLMKILLRQGAYFSKAYQREVGARPDEIKVPNQSSGGSGFVCLKKNLYPQLLKDEAYFSDFDALERIRLSENVTDLGEYLARRPKDNGLTAPLGEVTGRMVYYAPCHQREQKIKHPYLDLMRRIPGLTIEPVGGVMDCCGMGGSLGYKREFYAASIRLAGPLVQKIQAAAPDAIVTDCLSCRLQFQHLLPYPVHHPLEVLARAWENSPADASATAQADPHFKNR